MPAKICIIGTGYVGMASAIGLAELGCTVVGYDVAIDLIAGLRAGTTPYHEAGIEESIRRHLDSGRLSFVADLDAAVDGAQFVVVCVGTPARHDGAADLSGLSSAVAALRRSRLRRSSVVVVRSTVPPGTSDGVAESLRGRADVVYAPEFLREGSAVHDFLHPDRIVIGAASLAAASSYARLFESLQVPLVFTTRRNAELVKAVSNAFLALKISFANEVANLCDVLGADAEDVLRGAAYDRRIGPAYLGPGIGFGGPCFEKDLRSLDHIASQTGIDCRLFATTLSVNDRQQRRVVEILAEELGTLAGAHVGVWGLAFKPGTDDVRDSLALRILTELRRRGATVTAFDPSVHLAPLPEGCTIAASALEAAEADALLVLTEWPSFRQIAPAAIAARVRRGLVVDGRNVLDAQRIVATGLRYRGIGRTAEPRPERLVAAV